MNLVSSSDMLRTFLVQFITIKYATIFNSDERNVFTYTVTLRQKP